MRSAVWNHRGQVQPGRRGVATQRVVAHRCARAAPLVAGASVPPSVRDVPPDRGEQLVGLLEPPRQTTDRAAGRASAARRRAGPTAASPTRSSSGRERGHCDPGRSARLCVVARVEVVVGGSVLHARAGRHQHRPPGEAGAPAQVDVVAVRAVRRTARCRCQTSRSTSIAHPSTASTSRIAIELALVDLARLQRRHRVPEPVDRPADVAQRRAGDPDPRPSRRRSRRASVLQRRGLDEAGDGVLVQHGVAVEQEDVVGRAATAGCGAPPRRTARSRAARRCGSPAPGRGRAPRARGCRRRSRRRSRARRRRRRSGSRGRAGTRGARARPPGRRGSRAPTGSAPERSPTRRKGWMRSWGSAVLARRRA